jgi:hypothetical protein
MFRQRTSRAQTRASMATRRRFASPPCTWKALREQRKGRPNEPDRPLRAIPPRTRSRPHRDCLLNWFGQSMIVLGRAPSYGHRSSESTILRLLAVLSKGCRGYVLKVRGSLLGSARELSDWVGFAATGDVEKIFSVSQAARGKIVRDVACQ